MVEVTPSLTIDENEIEISFIQASGPGGQNVNKVATAAQLRYDVAGSPSLPEDVRRRLLRLASQRITKEGVLVIDAREFRTQERNRRAAIERLVDLVRRAAVRPKRRRRTRPSIKSRRRRLESKRHRGQIKRLRKRVPGHED